MPTRLVHIVMDARDPVALARFWAAALGWEVTPLPGDEVRVAPAGLRYPDPAVVPLLLVPVPEPKAGKNRAHLDLASASPAHQAELVSRVRELGAGPADIGQGDVPWVVLADPEGNEFCVLEPRAAYRDTGPVAALVMDCADPVALAPFWAAAAGWPPRRAEPGLTGLRSPAGAGPYLELLAVPDAGEHDAREHGTRPGKSRVHPDLAPPPDGDTAAEAARLRALGARPADIGQGDVPWVVLADPQGAEFCVLTPR
jgi:hypothetical protein